MRKSVRLLFDRVSKSRGYIASYRVDSVEAAEKIKEWAEQIEAPVVLNARELNLVRKIKDLASQSTVPVIVHADIEGGAEQIRQAVDAGCDSLGVAGEMDKEIRQYVKDRGGWVEIQDDGGSRQMGDAVRVELPLVKGAYTGINYVMEDDWRRLVSRLGGQPISAAGGFGMRNKDLREIGLSLVYRVEMDLSLLMIDRGNASMVTNGDSGQADAVTKDENMVTAHRLRETPPTCGRLQNM